METTVLQRLKETISSRAQNITDLLKNAAPQTIKIRTGSAAESSIQEELSLLQHTMQKTEDKTIGLCEVCNDFVETRRLEMDYTACVCIEHMTGAERTILENDLELSAKVQQALLPHVVPHVQHVDIAAFSQPARIVGGDYFDFLKFKDGSHAILIADVMGKGMPASMLMASLQASIRIIIPESSEPSEVVARLNHLFCHNIRLTNFVTLFLAKYRETDRTFTYCNAGHNPPLVRRRDGTIESMQPTGAAIGLIEQTSFEQRDMTLHSGDSVLIYTDGVVESMNEQKELFGQQRLEDYVRHVAHTTAHQTISGLKEQLKNFSSTTIPSDDTTIIALKVLA